jgi:hypothetical protein
VHHGKHSRTVAQHRQGDAWTIAFMMPGTDGLVWEAPIGDGTNQNSLEAITFGPL